MELKEELVKLEKTCREQQQVINQAISKGPANNTEACLQHEISRLTGENFDLREKIENLNETIKRLKKQLRSYMRKLNEVGGKKQFMSLKVKYFCLESMFGIIYSIQWNVNN